MANYLVTGGAGFIGSHLADELVSSGHHVRIIDDLSSGKWENIPAHSEFIHADIRNVETLYDACRDMDGCFHLAAIASVERSCEEWVETHRTNLTASIGVFDCANRFNLPVVYASSAAVYGNNLRLPLSVGCELSPTSPYGADKAAMELHAKAAAASFGLGTVGMRFFNVYGPRQDPASPYSGVISVFFQRLLAGQDIIIHGNGDQTRDFIYVSDVVRALTRAMQLCRSGTAAIFNVCSGRETTINALAGLLAQKVGARFNIKHGEARQGDIFRSFGCAELANRELAFEAEIELSEGLDLLLASGAG